MRMQVLSDRLRTSPVTGAVIPADTIEGGIGRSLESEFSRRHVIRVPRGGVASFQIVVTPEKPGDGAEIALSAGPWRASAAALDEAAVFYQWPCQISDTEWTFEGLVPADAYRAAGSPARQCPLGDRPHHAFWIDVPVTGYAKPGMYQGHVTVASVEPVTVEIEVLPLDLPLSPRITVDLNSYASRIENNHPGLSEERLIECETSYYREAHDNRAVLHYLPYGHAGELARGYAPPLAGRGRSLRVTDWTGYDRRFGPLFDGRAMAGSPGGERPIPHWYLPVNFDWPADYAYYGTRGYDHEFAQILAEFRRHIHEKGWTSTDFEVFFNHKKRYRYYPYDGDERKQEADRGVFQHYRSLIDRSASIAGAAGCQARVLYRTDISWSFAHDAGDDQIGPLYDLWVANFNNFSWTRAGVEAILARGQKAWWYGGGSGPGAHIMDHDRLAVLCWRRGGDGFMPQWLAMAGDASLDRADSLSMLYPGRRFGLERALGSIRLRRVRSGTETTDLLEMLGADGRAIVDDLAHVTDEDWWTPTPAWALCPPETMTNEMYEQQRVGNPMADCDPHTPAAIRERAIDALLGR